MRIGTRTALVLAGTTAFSMATAGTAAADPFRWWASQPHGLRVADDTVRAGRDGVARGDLLANDVTDRGPNADGGDGTTIGAGNKVEPDDGSDPAHPLFHPQIGRLIRRRQQPR